MKFTLLIFFLSCCTTLAGQPNPAMDTSELKAQIAEAQEIKDIQKEYELVYKLCDQFNGLRLFDRAISEYQRFAKKSKALGIDTMYQAMRHAESFMYYFLKRNASLDSINEIFITMENPMPTYLASAYYFRGIAQYENNQFLEAKENLLKGAEIYGSENDSLRVFAVYSNLGKTEYQLGDIQASIEYFLEAMKYFSEDMMPFQITGVYNKLSNAYSAQGNLYKALEYSNKALDISRTFKNQRYYNQLAVTHASILIEENKLDSAKSLLDQSLAYFNENNYDKYKCPVFFSLAKLHFKEGNFSLVKNALDSLTRYKEFITENIAWFNYHDLHADYYKNKGDLIQYKNYIDSSLYYLKNTSAKRQMVGVYDNLYEYNKAIGKSKEALTYLEKVRILKDSLFKLDQLAITQDLEAQYQKHEQDQQIAELNAENKITQLKLSQQRTISIVSIIALLLLSILAYFISKLYRQTKAQNEIIQKSVEEKDILLREIHHRVKNNLQFISSLLKLQSRHIEDPTALNALKEGQDRVKSMALIHQNLYQEENLTGVDVKNYFEKLTANLFHSYNISPDNIDLELNIDDVNLDVDSVIPIGLIVNELISNALKYAFPDSRKGKIEVSLKELGNQLKLSVKDDGIGMDKNQSEKLDKSFGYRLINAFKSQLDADLDIKSDGGTTVSLIIKDFKKVA